MYNTAIIIIYFSVTVIIVFNGWLKFQQGIELGIFGYVCPLIMKIVQVVGPWYYKLSRGALEHYSTSLAFYIMHPTITCYESIPRDNVNFIIYSHWTSVAIRHIGKKMVFQSDSDGFGTLFLLTFSSW